MTVIQSVLIRRRRIADDSSNLSHMIVDDGLQHRIRMTFADEATVRRRNKLTVDGFTGAIVMKVEYFIAQRRHLQFPVKHLFLAKVICQNSLPRKKWFFSFKTFFCCALLSNFLQTNRKKKQFYNLGRYMCALAV